eukprot:gnl/MRDRNA2_/MRDRNA2_67397_c0_seq2.p1 gnl/MRDRNA2_/MRDRNA2_67397_c0~~gnl/MRDRNA2_/MRDRNA2_67397_c0_seq2.p1  ORF type:complete len:191 (-),score=18.55 gnl/MRDRNA2_/MRDRNA2_67397_c0_seq2:186-758(-)
MTEVTSSGAGAWTYIAGHTGQGKAKREFGPESGDPANKVEIFHSETILDRKSSFQGHLAHVNSAAQVSWAHRQILSNKSFASAKHNIFAYRYRCKERGIIVSHDDDDGENGAGARLAQLLNFHQGGVEGIFICVTRWYGGVQLGSDRYRHIVHCAKCLLPSSDTPSSSGKSAQVDKDKSTKRLNISKSHK